MKSRPRARGWALLVLASLVGCAHATLDQGRQAHAEGRLEDADRLLREVRARDSTSEVEQLVIQVAAERRAVAAWLTERALALARSSETAAELDAAERHLAQARDLAPDGSSERTRAEQALASFGARRVQLTDEYLDLRRDLATAAGCRADRLAALRRLAQLREQLGRSEPLVPALLETARACQDAGSDPTVASLAELTADVARPGDDPPTMIWARGLRARERMLAAAAAAPPVAVAHEAPPPPRPPAAPKPGPGEQIVATARTLFEAGDIFVALAMVDEGIASLEGNLAESLVKQRSEWTDARAKLVQDFLERGEKALRAEKTNEAAQWYERVLKLDPGHVVARDRMRKIEALRKLKSGAGG